MKKIILWYCSLCLGMTVQAQQNRLHSKLEVQDAQSGKNIAYGMLCSLNSGKCFEIENGKVEINYTQENLADTLFIDAQGYMNHKMTISDLLKEGKMKLNARPKPIIYASTNAGKKELLNGYDKQSIGQWLGLPDKDRPFRYIQMGQIFDNSYPGATLNKITLNQLLFDLPKDIVRDNGRILLFRGNTDPITGTDKSSYMRSYILNQIQSSAFRLRIYQLDNDNMPIAELCQNQIKITPGFPEENIPVNLAKHNIVLPKGKFMVAVEWIQTPGNFSYIVWEQGKYNNGQSLRPFIGVNDKKGNKLNVMALDLGGNWKPFDYLSPYYTDLAMACEISY
ncbi:hypothetical protein [Pedobacter frigoris]|uniref:Uncharacterized protein n=1 Tax=Pedobacter frigoris TaxID=2571272 RepID=A0A4U1CIE9_9SPHI|nr:hypothetical protein [Pedobacter frigoris]TKC07187.1 hypothetical protein FA047_07980 [Pedobacter frigoris]